MSFDPREDEPRFEMPEGKDDDFGVFSHLDGATFFAQVLRLRMHEVAGVMHLSGMFDVSEAAVAQVAHN